MLSVPPSGCLPSGIGWLSASIFQVTLLSGRGSGRASGPGGFRLARLAPPPPAPARAVLAGADRRRGVGAAAGRTDRTRAQRETGHALEQLPAAEAAILRMRHERCPVKEAGMRLSSGVVRTARASSASTPCGSAR